MTGKANNSRQVITDTNENVFTVAFDENGLKSDSKRQIVDPEENWIGRFLYGGPIGYAVNFILLTASTIYLTYSLNRMWNDEESYKSIIESYWLPQIIQFFIIVVPVDLLLCASIVLIVFPLSRISRCTFYYWFLGLVSSAVIFVLMWLLRGYGVLGTRAFLVLNWARLSMKIASLLIECNWNEQVYEKSSMKTVLYYLFIPCLVYNYQYPRARQTRWIKALCHFWWLAFGATALLLYVLEILPSARIDLLTVDSEKLFWVSLAGISCVPILYPIMSWFFMFETFCSLHSEVLRYPDFKFFGTLSDLRSDPLTCINRPVSKWLGRYIYIPVMKSSGSRVLAIWCVMSLSLTTHEIGYYFTTDIILLYSITICATIVPLILSIRPEKKINQILLLIFVGPLFFYWLNSYSLEFLAWNYSSMPDVYKLSRLRLVPLAVTQLTHNFYNSTG